MPCRWRILAALASLLTALLVAAQNPPSQVPRSVLQQAAAEYQQGKLAQAEQAMRAALKQAPHDAAALNLLGVVLDAQQRYDEAEASYRQALALAPGSPAILNNLGSHYLTQGKSAAARAAFLKVLARDPKHANANLQMARLSVTAQQGASALKYLNQLPPDEASVPAVAILRAKALALNGQTQAAEDLLAEVAKRSGDYPRVSFSIGLTFVDWKRYADAEKAFTHALDAAPADFDILYNLGLAAQRAGHLDRALQVYQVALQQRPNDADCLYNLANLYTQKHNASQAAVLLVQAHNAAPARADILLALAQTSEDMGFFGDAASALGQYLQLKPHDDVARRERGFCLVRSAKLNQGLTDLRWYTQKYPRDARGLYELAVAEAVREPGMALEHLSQALALDPQLNAARYARSLVYYQMGRTADSIEDLKRILGTEPDNFRALDALGQDYLRLDQYPEAAQALERAAQLAPQDPRVLMHYSRALLRLDRRDEAAKVTAAFQKLGPDETRRRPYGGLFDFLNLRPEEQFNRYLMNLQSAINTRPEDPTLRVRLGRALLYAGKTPEALEAFRAARHVTSDPNLLASMGRSLLDYEQFVPAREFLEPAVAANPSAADPRLDLAIAVFHSDGPEAGLQVLDGTPAAQRKGDYFLLRAQILDAMQKPEEAARALNRGLSAAPTRPDLYFQAALFLIKHARYQQAVRLLDQASQAFPDSAELQLTEAIAYALLGQHDDAARLLTQIEARSPEWAMPYTIHGITLVIRSRPGQAQPVLEDAIALGANDGITYYYLALAMVNASPEKTVEAQEAITQALKLNPDDVYVRALAGRIAYLRKDYPAALEHLSLALRAWPDMIEAHQNLAAVYRALGDREKSAEHLQAVVRIKQQNPAADQSPSFLAEGLLFAVHPPTPPAM